MCQIENSNIINANIYYQYSNSFRIIGIKLMTLIGFDLKLGIKPGPEKLYEDRFHGKIKGETWVEL